MNSPNSLTQWTHQIHQIQKFNEFTKFTKFNEFAKFARFTNSMISPNSQLRWINQIHKFNEFNKVTKFIKFTRFAFIKFTKIAKFILTKFTNLKTITKIQQKNDLGAKIEMRHFLVISNTCPTFCPFWRILVRPLSNLMVLHDGWMSFHEFFTWVYVKKNVCCHVTVNKV